MSLSTNTTYRVLVEKLGAANPIEFIGNEGELFYDPSIPSIYLSDGSTPGGVPVAGGGGGGESYWVSTATGITTSANVGVGATFLKSKLTVNPNIIAPYWALTYGDTGIGVTEQSAAAIAYDSVGNIYASGADYDNGIPFVVKFDNGGNILWQKFYEHSDPNRGYKMCDGLAVDKNDDSVYVSVNVDDLIGSSFLLKLDSSGNIVWQREIYDGVGNDRLYAIAISDSGNVYIAGATNSQGAGGNEGIVIKFDSSGNQLWQKIMGCSGYDSIESVSLDSNENVYTVGYSNIISNGCIILVKLDSSGNEIWQRYIDDVSYDWGTAVKVDSSDNIYVAGFTYSQGAGLYDMILVKFDSSGNELWQRTLGDSNYNQAFSIAVDSSDNVYVGGQTYYSDSKINIACFDPSGNLLKQKNVYSGNGEYQWYYYGHSLIDIRNDELIIGGYTYNTLPETYSEVFLAKLPTNLDGNYYFRTNVNQNFFIVEDSNNILGISTLTVGISTLIVSTSTIGIAVTSGITTITSPPNYVAEIGYLQNSIEANGFSFLENLQSVKIVTKDLNINGLPFGNSKNTNFVVGSGAGTSITTGNNNNFLGCAAGRHNTTGFSNNFFGILAGYKNTTGRYNNFFGYLAGDNNTIGSYNNFSGFFSGMNNIDGNSNNIFGAFAGYGNTSGNSNNFIGYQSGSSNSSGSYNNFFGYRAGQGSNGHCNIYIGKDTGSNISPTEVSNRIIIGSGYNNVFTFNSPSGTETKNMQLAVGLTTEAFSTKYWLVGNENFDVGIGVDYPTSKLHVGGTVCADGFISVGNTTPIKIEVVGNTLTFTAVGIGSTSFILT